MSESTEKLLAKIQEKVEAKLREMQGNLEALHTGQTLMENNIKMLMKQMDILTKQRKEEQNTQQEMPTQENVIAQVGLQGKQVIGTSHNPEKSVATVTITQTREENQLNDMRRNNLIPSCRTLIRNGWQRRKLSLSHPKKPVLTRLRRGTAGLGK